MASSPSSTNFAGVELMAENSTSSPGCGSSESRKQRTKSVRDQDKYLPITNISRIMRKAVPKNSKITKESKEFVQECVSDFINHITSEASVKCREDKRKTISGDDLQRAMSRLGFEHYNDPIIGYMIKYIEGDNKRSTKGAGGLVKENEGVGGSARENGDNEANK